MTHDVFVGTQQNLSTAEYSRKLFRRRSSANLVRLNLILLNLVRLNQFGSR